MTALPAVLQRSRSRGASRPLKGGIPAETAEGGNLWFRVSWFRVYGFMVLGLTNGGDKPEGFSITTDRLSGRLALQ